MNTYNVGKGIRMTSKLTLSVDDQVVRRAKKYAADRGTSVSRLVEQYLDQISRPPPQRVTPVLQRLRGCLAGLSLDEKDYRKHLERKYR